MGEEKKANYWPHAIAGSIIAVFGLCLWTIKSASENPVQMDDYYFEDYHKVEENYGKILQDRAKFDKLYNVKTIANNFIQNEKNSIQIALQDKEGNAINDANITILITRPDSAAHNKHPKLLSVKDGVYSFESFVVKLPGRWQIKSKIKYNNLIRFIQSEVNATK